MTFKQRKDAFIQLGTEISEYIQQPDETIDHLFHAAYIGNGWFTKENITAMLNEISEQLKEESINKWLDKYEVKDSVESKRVGLILAGNIPLVGFHDVLCVLITGHTAVIKLSSDDKILLPFLLSSLINIAPDFKSKIEYVENLREKFDAVIATGSDNSARYFEYYFGKYPNIIRKNRSSVAVLTGNESEEDMKNLSHDIFTYFGLGCRNVSKLYVPKGYSLDEFYKGVFDYKDVVDNKKYGNNYDYNRAILLMRQAKFFDNNFLMVHYDNALAAPVGVVNCEEYENITEVNVSLNLISEKLQCIVSNAPEIEHKIAFGTTQKPNLWDYADGVDTIKFLLSLSL